jgi:hypothetical protein
MGMEQAVQFGGAVPAWDVVRQLLAGHGYPVQLRMIDGELAFPDEALPETWRDLRVGTPGGMVTVRREPGRVVCVTWGNAQGEMLQAWHALTWAFAAAGGGRVEAAAGPLTAAEYGRTAELPAVLRPQ